MVLDGIGAELVDTDSARNPIPASAIAIAGSVIVTRSLCCCIAVKDRILTFRCRYAIIAGTGADLAERAVIFRVGIQVMEGTGTFTSGDIASFADGTADSIAAVAINALVG